MTGEEEERKMGERRRGGPLQLCATAHWWQAGKMTGNTVFFSIRDEERERKSEREREREGTRQRVDGERQKEEREREIKDKERKKEMDWGRERRIKGESLHRNTKCSTHPSMCLRSTQHIGQSVNG